MTTLVIGLGSMGKRRIGLIKEIAPDIEIIGVDNNEKRRREVEKSLDLRTFDSINDAMAYKKADCVFVCTSPESHASIIEESLLKGLNVFTEINLIADLYEHNIELAEKNGLVLFLSSTFLYRKEIQYLCKRVKDSSKPYIYNYHVGQYLPDWHPWENYKDFFVGNRKTNACREIFAIELPWIVSVFGKIVEIKVDKSKNSSLNIDYPDTYLVKFKHENGNTGVVTVDVISRKPVRKLELFNEDLYLTWNGKVDSIADYDIESKVDRTIELGESIHKEGYADFISENPYRDEIADFFDVICGKKAEGKWSFEKDKNILAIIDAIEQ